LIKKGKEFPGGKSFPGEKISPKRRNLNEK